MAALSSAAKIFSESGGIQSSAEESLLIGQIQVVNPPDAEEARNQILFHKNELIKKLNELHPKMVARGGGVQDIEVRTFEQTERNPLMLIVHVLVDTCDAMGANIINSMCEEIAADIEALTEGRVFLRILSNLTDRSVVKASVVIPTEKLEGKGYPGEEVRDGRDLPDERFDGDVRGGDERAGAGVPGGQGRALQGEVEGSGHAGCGAQHPRRREVLFADQLGERYDRRNLPHSLRGFVTCVVIF